MAPICKNAAAGLEIVAGCMYRCVPAEPVTSSGRSAFTLIEVLVSMVILATGIVLILRSFETSVIALAEARDALRATSLLEEKLAEIRSQTAASRNLSFTSRGSFDEPYQNYSWSVNSRSSGIARVGRQGTNALEELTVTVRREGSSVEYGATTYLRTGS